MSSASKSSLVATAVVVISSTIGFFFWLNFVPHSRGTSQRAEASVVKALPFSVLVTEGPVHEDSEAWDGYDWTKCIAFGSHIYFSFGEGGLPAHYVRTPLKVLAAYEEQHLDREVVNWNRDVREGRLYGLWVDVRPKAPPGPEKK